MAARDAKVVSVNPFFLEKELLPKQTWPDGTPNIRAQLTSLWVLGQPHSALGVPPPPEPPRFGSLRSPEPPCCGCGPPVSCLRCFGGGGVDETEPGTPKAAGKTTHDLRGFDDVFGVDQSPDEWTAAGEARAKKKAAADTHGSDDGDWDSEVQCDACAPFGGGGRRRRRRKKGGGDREDDAGSDGARRRRRRKGRACGALNCADDWSSSDGEGSLSGGRKKSRRRRRGKGGEDRGDDDFGFGGCFAFVFGISEEERRRRERRRMRDARIRERRERLHGDKADGGSDAGVGVSDDDHDDGYNSAFDPYAGKDLDRGKDFPDWHLARAPLKGVGFVSNREKVYAAWKPRRPIDVSFSRPSVLLMSQMAFVFSQPMWRCLAAFQRVDPALCAEPEMPHVTGERSDVYERLKEEARVYRVSHQTQHACATWSEDMLGAFLGCVFATAAWSCALRDPRNKRRRRRRKIETFLFFGVLRGWHDAARAHHARVESRRVNLELMAFLAKQHRQKRWEASLNETWDDVKTTDGVEGSTARAAAASKAAMAASNESNDGGGESVSFMQRIVKIGTGAMDAAGNALGAGDDATKGKDGDEGEGDADDDVDATDGAVGEGAAGEKSPAVKLLDDDGAGPSALSRTASISRASRDEREGEGGNDGRSGGMFDFMGAEWSAQSNPENATDATSLYDETVARALRGAVRRHRNKLKGRRAFWPAIEELSLNDGVHAKAKPAAAPDETEDDRDVPIGPVPINRISPHPMTTA